MGTLSVMSIFMLQYHILFYISGVTGRISEMLCYSEENDFVFCDIIIKYTLNNSLKSDLGEI